MLLGKLSIKVSTWVQTTVFTETIGLLKEDTTLVLSITIPRLDSENSSFWTPLAAKVSKACVPWRTGISNVPALLLDPAWVVKYGVLFELVETLNPDGIVVAPIVVNVAIPPADEAVGTIYPNCLAILRTELRKVAEAK